MGGGGGAVEGVGAEGAAVASSVLSIMSTMQLRVEFRAVVMMPGFRSLVSLIDNHLELWGCIPHTTSQSCILLAFSMLASAASITASCHRLH